MVICCKNNNFYIQRNFGYSTEVFNMQHNFFYSTMFFGYSTSLLTHLMMKIIFVFYQTFLYATENIFICNGKYFYSINEFFF